MLWSADLTSCDPGFLVSRGPCLTVDCEDGKWHLAFHCQVGLNWVADQVELEQEEILSLETETLFKAKLSLPTCLQFGISSSSWWWSLSSAVSPSRGCCIGDTSLLQGLHLLGAYSISGVVTSRFVLLTYQSFVYTDSHNVWDLRDFFKYRRGPKCFQQATVAHVSCAPMFQTI